MGEDQGIRSTVVVNAPADCPLTTLAASLERPIRLYRTSVPPADGTPVAMEFIVEGTIPDTSDIESVFDAGSFTVGRLLHDDGHDCPCTVLGRHNTPISRLTTENGRIGLVFYSETYEQLQAIVSDLQTAVPDLDIRQLVREPPNPRADQFALVDTGRLTERQRELLAFALEQGYFERPRRANAAELADEVGIDPSTFREHIDVALQKILDEVLAPGT